MKTKTEELLEETKKRMRSGSILFDELEQHLAPLIAKERVITMLREIENTKQSMNYCIYYDDCKYPNGLDVGDDLGNVRINDLELYSTYEAWTQVINEMPETIIEAFGWADLCQ